MATRLIAITGRVTALAQSQPRVAVGGSMLCCIVLLELVAAVAIHGGLS